jgi:hypothetical protein
MQAIVGDQTKKPLVRGSIEVEAAIREGSCHACGRVLDRVRRRSIRMKPAEQNGSIERRVVDHVVDVPVVWVRLNQDQGRALRDF